MKTEKSYAVIQGDDGEKFCKTVSALMEQGYEPVGGVAVAVRGTSVGFFQALVRIVVSGESP
jgi:hypothetical protein